MNAIALPLSGAPLLQRDWLASVLLHGALLGGALWLAAGAVPPTQRLEVVLGWAAPEPVPPPPQPATAPPPAPPPLPSPRLRPAEPPRPKAAPPPQAPAKVFDSAPLQSAPAVALPQASVTPAAPAAPVVAAVAPAPPAPEVVVPTHSAPVASAVVDDHRYQQWRTRLEQTLLQSKRYPSAARRMGQSGTVVVHLRMAADGSLLHCRLHDSSGFKVLDQAAEQLVRSVAQSIGVQEPPGRATDLRIPIVYELTES